MNDFVVTIRDGFNNMDFESVTGMLAKSYWSPGIKIGEVKQGAINSAIVVGAFTNDGRQVGYARAVSDMTRFAYIMDVIIDEEFRKQGIGQSMIKHILNHESLKDVYQWLLITKDAHEMYSKIGFERTKRPADWMEIKKERPKR
jgi:ribosomal protein S18 acetylase RimI-like enzyme